jgi:hypothetical protein
MNGLNNQTSVQPAASDLQVQFEQLRHLVASILVLLVVISAVFDIYLLRQVKLTKRDLNEFRPQVAQMLAAYQKSWNGFVVPVAEYGRTHPDFAAVLAKYGLKAGALTNLPPATPAASPPKK